MKPNFSFKYNGENFCAEHLPEFEKGVSVTHDKKEYKEYDAVEWVLWFENKADCDSGIFSDILDCDAVLPMALPEIPRAGYRPTKGDLCVVTMNGMVEGKNYWENDKVSATEYGLNYEYLDKAPNQTKKFENIGGRSSDGMMPFFDVTSKDCGYIVAIGWTGDWKAEVSRTDEGVAIRTGLKETNFYLKPGEKIRTSSILIMKYSADEDKYNKFRRLIKNHYSHKSCTGAGRDGLMACELWGGLTSEEMKKRLNEFAKYDIKFEDVWIDAGWYGNCTKCDDAFSGDWSMHTGNWNVNQRVHPQGLRDVAEVANGIGMKLMLWVEPERAIEGTTVCENHPEWFLSLPDNISKILYYGNDDARNYVCDMLSEHIEKLNLSCYRQDFNTPLADYFKAYDEANRRGIHEIKHITGMYKMWDTLLEKYPHLLIDNCSSGGRRIDIETLKRSIPFFRSDYQCNFNENPEVLQCHNAGISKYLPYNGCTSKTKGDIYAIRSSYSSSWGGAFYNAIFQSMTEEDFLWAKKVTDEYRRIRKYMSMDFHSHGSDVFDESSWAIWQYHDEESQSGIIMAFRRCNSPFDRVTVKLKGTKDNVTYSYENFDSSNVTEGNNELEIILPEKRSSTIIEYKAK